MILGMVLAEEGIPARFLPGAGVFHDYHTSLGRYLIQRFSFAANSVKLYIEGSHLPSRFAAAKVRYFNPLRVALAMFFNMTTCISLLFTATLAGLGLSARLFIPLTGCLIGLFVEMSVHGRFLLFLRSRHGMAFTLSYLPLLFVLDFVYFWGTIKAP